MRDVFAILSHDTISYVFDKVTHSNKVIVALSLMARRCPYETYSVLCIRPN